MLPVSEVARQRLGCVRLDRAHDKQVGEAVQQGAGLVGPVMGGELRQRLDRRHEGDAALAQLGRGLDQAGEFAQAVELVDDDPGQRGALRPVEAGGDQHVGPAGDEAARDAEFGLAIGDPEPRRVLAFGHVVAEREAAFRGVAPALEIAGEDRADVGEQALAAVLEHDGRGGAAQERGELSRAPGGERRDQLAVGHARSHRFTEISEEALSVVVPGAGLAVAVGNDRAGEARPLVGFADLFADCPTMIVGERAHDDVVGRPRAWRTGPGIVAGW